MASKMIDLTMALMLDPKTMLSLTTMICSNNNAYDNDGSDNNDGSDDGNCSNSKDITPMIMAPEAMAPKTMMAHWLQ